MIQPVSFELIQPHDKIFEKIDTEFSRSEKNKIKRIATIGSLRISVAAQAHSQNPNASEKQLVKLADDLEDRNKWPRANHFWSNPEKGKGKFIPKKMELFLDKHLEIIKINASDKLFIYKDNRYFHDINENLMENAMTRLLRDKYSQNFISKVTNLISADNMVSADRLDENTHLRVENGILKLEDTCDYLIHHSAEYLDTTKIPVAYNQNAECPRFKKFLREILPNEKDRKTVQELFGFALMSDFKRFNKMALFLGSGEDGKSTLIRVLKNLVGESNTSSLALTGITDNQFRPFELVDSKVNIDGDLNAETISSNRLKKLTGGDGITVEEKYERPFQYQNDTALFFLSNKLPSTKDTTRGFYRRWIIIEFNQKFTEQVGDGNKDADKRLDEKLCNDNELQGVLNWAVKGYNRLTKNERFTKTWSPEFTKSYWNRESDSISFFVEKRVRRHGNSIMPKDSVFYFYKKFCDKNGLESYSEQQFKQKMTNTHNFKPVRKRLHNQKRYQCWKNIDIV